MISHLLQRLADWQWTPGWGNLATVLVATAAIEADNHLPPLRQ
jgi:hypothetical protein